VSKNTAFIAHASQKPLFISCSMESR
jgi:hypothetical protein